MIPRRLSHFIALPPLVVILLHAIPALSSGGAGFYHLSEDQGVFGTVGEYTIEDDDETLTGLAVRYDLGYNEITDANKGIDPWYPVKGTKVRIPTSWILPELPPGYEPKGGNLVVLNLAEFRLYLLKRDKGRLTVTTFPVGIGREGFDTPEGVFRITEKLKDPAWRIPESFRNEYPELPDVVPPGPDNPLGRYALRLSNPLYLIHGTNKPLGVGRRVSHGCIRMYPDDIERLYRITNVGDDVIILYQPVKAGLRDNIPYIEVHRDYRSGKEPFQEAVNLLRRRGLLRMADLETLYSAILEESGVPVRLTAE